MDNNYGYGPNNPEPQAMKDSAVVRTKNKDSFHSAEEYIEGDKLDESDTAKPTMPCKNSLPS